MSGLQDYNGRMYLEIIRIHYYHHIRSNIYNIALNSKWPYSSVLTGITYITNNAKLFIYSLSILFF